MDMRVSFEKVCVMKKKRFFVMLICMVSMVVGTCFTTLDVINAGTTGTSDDSNQPKKTLEDFANAKIGISTGSSHDATVKELFPNAERVYFDVLADMVLAVSQGKIDCYVEDAPYLPPLYWEGVTNVAPVEEPIKQVKNGFVFPQSKDSVALREQVNAFISTCQADGTMDELITKWFGKTEPTEHPDYTKLTGENGTIRLAVVGDGKPLIYLRDNLVTGFEVDILMLFAEQYGYTFDIEMIPFTSVVAGISAGKYDMAAAGMNITAEREESVDFSDAYTLFDVVLVTKAEEDSTTKVGFWEELKGDFEKTFIRENRWKMIVKGVGVTMLISICSAVFGTMLGFGLYMLTRSDAKSIQKAAKVVAKIYSRIVAGTPIIVILMILFYVVFGKSQDVSGVFVAIIGFTLTFGSFVCDHMTVSVDSVDFGQTEAAYSLGYPKNKTFFRIIFPQAMTIFLPSYCGQAVELIKATAVVGYVAVTDLTKMGDLIRSSTYEAFFPLIITAIIYFLLTWILAAVLNLAKLHFEPKRRSKEEILKGVKAE